MHPAERILTALFLLWTLASLAFQFPRTHRRLALPYELGFLSAFRFFATPRSLDTLVEVRSLASTGAPTPWRPAFPPARRAWHTTFWNPHARAANAHLLDATRILGIARRHGRAAATRTPPFQHLLAACTLPHPIQFRILRGQTFDTRRPLTPVFQSEWHSNPL